MISVVWSSNCIHLFSQIPVVGTQSEIKTDWDRSCSCMAKRRGEGMNLVSNKMFLTQNDSKLKDLIPQQQKKGLSERIAEIKLRLTSV